MNKKLKFSILILFSIGIFFIYLFYKSNSSDDNISRKDISDSVNNTIQNKKTEKLSNGKIDSVSSQNRSIAGSQNSQNQNIPPELEELLQKYEAYINYSYNEQTYSLSSTYQAMRTKIFQASPSGTYGDFLEVRHGFTLFKPKSADKLQYASVFINHLTHQVGIVTGKILVKVENNEEKLKKLAQDEGFQLGKKLPYVDLQEVFVKPASKTFDVYDQIIKSGFSFSEVQIIEADYETR